MDVKIQNIRLTKCILLMTFLTFIDILQSKMHINHLTLIGLNWLVCGIFKKFAHLYLVGNSKGKRAACSTNLSLSDFHICSC